LSPFHGVQSSSIRLAQYCAERQIAGTIPTPIVYGIGYFVTLTRSDGTKSADPQYRHNNLQWLEVLEQKEFPRHMPVPSTPMKQFRSLDGTRGWLAWSVVVFHMILLTAAYQWKPILAHIDYLHRVRVPCFFIISGFVITHLLLEKRERYVPYIVRRFLRIYPLYIFCLTLGIFATYLHFAAFADHPWGDYVPQPDVLAQELAGSHGSKLGWHLLAHLTMTHGLVSNQALPASDFMFLGPAWQVSLEWQFYLLAPLILFGLRTRLGTIVLSLLAVMALAASQKGWFGAYNNAGFFPGAAIYFAVGIGTRMVYAKLPTLSAYPAAAIILVGGLTLFRRELAPVFFWIAFIAWLRVENATDPVSRAVDRFADLAFNSKIARFLGKRSYSTYLIHEPIIHIVVYVCIRKLALGIAPTVGVVFISVPIMTLGAAILLYKYIEAPGIALGKRLFKEPNAEEAGSADCQTVSGVPTMAAVIPGSC
jgi:peptidoglycan/LPS O-acetylase OafA/YrhL